MLLVLVCLSSCVLDAAVPSEIAPKARQKTEHHLSSFRQAVNVLLKSGEWAAAAQQKANRLRSLPGSSSAPVEKCSK